MWQAATSLGRDPLKALGVEVDQLDLETSMLALRMDNPKLDQEFHDDEDAAAIVARTRLKNAWKAALPGGLGYRGERGLQPPADARPGPRVSAQPLPPAREHRLDA